MKYSYYPGCTLKNKAKALDDYARACALILGFELEELESWQCCGGVYPLGADEIATKLSSVRALNDAKEKGQDLIAVCSACYHVLKRVNDDMKNDADTQLRANNYLGLSEPYRGETRVLHFLEVLRDRVGFDEVKKKVVKPLTGRKIGAYYGCLLLRPSAVMAFDDPGKSHHPGGFYPGAGGGACGIPLPQRVLRRIHIPEGKGAVRQIVQPDRRERGGLRRGMPCDRLPPVQI